MAVRRLDPDHPLFIESGYRINTKPVERMADFVLYNIQQGHHGCSLYSESGVGKSTAQDYLVETDWRWLVEDGRRAGVARAIVATSDACRSPLSFWHALSHQLGMPRWSSARPHELRARIHNHMRAACGHADVRRYVLFIDSAQRLTNLEFQCLEDLDNLMSKDRLTLFLVFVYQSDQRASSLATCGSTIRHMLFAGGFWTQPHFFLLRREMRSGMPCRATTAQHGGRQRTCHFLDTSPPTHLIADGGWNLKRR